jgi:hypothetical protein
VASCRKTSGAGFVSETYDSPIGSSLEQKVQEMKATLKTLGAIVIAAAVSLTTANAGDKEWKEDGVMMKNGKIMVMKDGQKTALEDESTTMGNLTVKKDGTITMKDGKKVTLQDGEMVTSDGTVMVKKDGKWTEKEAKE